MLVFAEGAPEANYTSSASCLRNNDVERIDLAVARKGAKQRDLRPALPLPVLPLRPVQHHCTITPPRQPLLFHVALPIRAIRVHQEQVPALRLPYRPEAAHGPPPSPHLPEVHPRRDQGDRRRKNEKTSP